MVDLSTGQAAAVISEMVRARKRYKRKPWKPIDHDKFRETRLLARLTLQQVASLLQVTERTVRHWENGEVAIPYAAYKLLRILTGYELPGAAWAGWSIRGDTLWSPANQGFTASQLSYLWLTFAMARHWQEYVLKLKPAANAGRSRQGAPALRLVK